MSATPTPLEQLVTAGATTASSSVDNALLQASEQGFNTPPDNALVDQTASLSLPFGYNIYGYATPEPVMPSESIYPYDTAVTAGISSAAAPASVLATVVFLVWIMGSGGR